MTPAAASTSATSSPAAANAGSAAAALGSQLATAIGGGTGLDMTALASNLADAQYAARLARIDSQSATLDTRISQAGQLKSDLLGLAASLGTRVRAGDLSAQPAVANAAVASASLPPGSSGIAGGSYSLEVTALATPQVLNSPAFASAAAPVGAGSLTIAFGTVSGGAFAADPAQAEVSIAIPAGASLADAAAAINAAGAGISAYVATSGDGAHLVMKGHEGAANGFTVRASEAPGDPGLAALGWDPANGTARLAATAGDAQYRLDGIARTAASNMIANAAPGLALKLTGTNAGAPTTIGYSDPSAAITGAMQDLTTALNSLAGELKTDTDPVGGTLSADPGARALARQLAALPGLTIMPRAVAGAPATLADLGLVVGKDGSFTLDGARLTATLAARPGDAAAMFTTGLYGVYGSLDTLSRTLASPTDPGALGGAVTRYTAAKATLATSRAALVAQQDKLRSQLIDRFARANASVAGTKATLTYLQNQIAAWNYRGN